MVLAILYLYLYSTYIYVLSNYTGCGGRGAGGGWTCSSRRGLESDLILGTVNLDIGEW